MMFHYANEFHVEAPPDEVMLVFSDVKRMAACVPGATLEGPDQDGAYPGMITVAFGPKKLEFTGRLSCEFDRESRTGTLVGRGSASVRGTNALVRSQFSIVGATAAQETSQRSLVRVSIEGEFTGIMGELAATAGPAMTSALLREFSQNLNASFSKPRENVKMEGPNSISGPKLLWNAMRSRIIP